MESMGRSYLGGSGYALSVWIATASSIVMLLYGYDEGILGNVIVSQNFLETMGYPSANILGTITSTFCLGAFLGAMITIWTGDILGRPRQILVGSIIIGIGATIQAASFSVSQIIVGRVVAGIGIGMNTSTAGVWQAETTKMSSRGKMVIIQMANCITGFVISNFLTLGFSFAKGSVSWRFPLAFQVFFACLLCCLLPFLPESPRLLIRKGMHREAMEVLAALEGSEATPSSSSIKAQFEIIKDILDREHLDTYSWGQLLTGKGPAGFLRRVVLGLSVMAMNLLAGINVPAFYMSYIFIHTLNLNALLARILAASSSVVFLLFSSAAYFTVERFGRRKCLMASSAVCCLSWVMISIALGLSNTSHGDPFKLGVVATLFFFVYYAGYGMGMLGTPWLYLSEINVPEIRTKANALAMGLQWLINYMEVQVAPPGIQNIGWRFWIIWACLCFGFIPIIYFFFPETANRTLEDIDRYYEANPSIIVAWDKAAISLERPLEYIRRDDEIAHRVGGEMNADLQNEMGIAWDVEKVEHTHEDLQDL